LYKSSNIIHLLRFEIEQNGHHEEKTNSSPVDEWDKRFIEVDALHLLKTTGTNRAFNFLMEPLGKRLFSKAQVLETID
jgi:hypothetical protein